ncbi:hypothetical protein HDA32_005978 [Spinactinospora alkalitolerans]|uniref:DUF3558 domain-containing protein n=1 Tax=Spinactinospora alkalitolerans TaxID=687207 RepID=A0A852U3Q6_9ACTN|nr:DUF3558 family protein [Spinactinospora alkalitolerans]NYE50858.1 hypothetical protein [Spinactinospora alkalitolerans]
MPPNQTGRRFNLVAILSSMLVVLAGCSSAQPSSSPSPSPSASPSPDPTELAPGLSRYAGFPCQLLDEQELADFGIVYAPREIDLSEGPATSCYWVTSTDIQLGFIPYPSDEARKNKTGDPDARQIEIAGYSAVQTADEESCYQNIALGPDDSFSTLVSRVETDAPEDTCGIATSFTELVILKLRRIS